jgi:CBS domain-containing protein
MKASRITIVKQRATLDVSHSETVEAAHRNGRLVGMFTNKDLERTSELEASAELKVRDLLQREPLTVYPDQTCRVAADTMAGNGVGRLAVVSRKDPSCLLGIITRSDLLKARHLQHAEESVKERILTKFPDPRRRNKAPLTR